MPPKKKAKRNITGLRNQSQATLGLPKQVVNNIPTTILAAESNPQPGTEVLTRKISPPEPPKDRDIIKGFSVAGMRAKCAPVCPWENNDCCMARLLSKENDFANQVSMLETVIHVAGHECIFLPKFHCELNPIEMYWGWAKYRYRQVPKKSFGDAKKAAIEALDACPTDVIRRFINRSWRFMSAYRIGLTGKAAAWAVQKHKGHRSVSRQAMMHIEAVLL